MYIKKEVPKIQIKENSMCAGGSVPAGADPHQFPQADSGFHPCAYVPCHLLREFQPAFFQQKEYGGAAKFKIAFLLPLEYKNF